MTTMSTERPAARSWRTTSAVVVVLVLGVLAAAALLVRFIVIDDPCPDYEDEGPMAAPGSPYAQLMCRAAVTLEPVPMEQVALPGALLVAAVVASVAAVLLVWQRPRLTSRPILATGFVGVLVVAPLLVIALQYTLPRDCLSGRTDAGECSRDRSSR